MAFLTDRRAAEKLPLAPFGEPWKGKAQILMSLEPRTPITLVRSIERSVAWLAAGEKPAARHRVGLETEKIGVVARTGEPAPLSAIHRLLARTAEATGGRLLVENGAAIGVQLEESSLSLEPGKASSTNCRERPVARLANLGRGWMRIWRWCTVCRRTKGWPGWALATGPSATGPGFHGCRAAGTGSCASACRERWRTT